MPDPNRVDEQATVGNLFQHSERYWLRLRLMGNDSTPDCPPRATLAMVKAVHTLAWFSIEACMVYVLYAGFAGRSDRQAAIAAGVVMGESMMFVANGCRCPLTAVAEQLGAQRASVTDIYLPRWFAHNLPLIHAPLIVLAAVLHTRNLRRRL